MEVELAKVTVENFEEVIALEVEEHQEDYVADNVYSIAESRFFPSYQPRAIYGNGKVVGFLMYQALDDEGQPEIFRVMVDRRYQRKGIGRKAMALVLDEIRSDCHVYGDFTGRGRRSDRQAAPRRCCR